MLRAWARAGAVLARVVGCVWARAVACMWARMVACVWARVVVCVWARVVVCVWARVAFVRAGGAGVERKGLKRPRGGAPPPLWRMEARGARAADGAEGTDGARKGDHAVPYARKGHNSPPPHPKTFPPNGDSFGGGGRGRKNFTWHNGCHPPSRRSGG